jgi:ribonuclease J
LTGLFFVNISNKVIKIGKNQINCATRRRRYVDTIKNQKKSHAISEKLNASNIMMCAVSGSEEIGMNMTVYSYESNKKTFTVLVDCGTNFMEVIGATVVMPDLPALIDKGLKIDAILITHGHNDHIGAIQYLHKYIPEIPIYAPPFACKLIEKQFKEMTARGYKTPLQLHYVELGSTLQFGPFSVKWVATTHSIPDSAMLAIEATGWPEENIKQEDRVRVLHTGDWKIDPDPIIGKHFDAEGLAEFGKRGVHALVGDSTNIHQKNRARSEGEVAASLCELITKTKTGKFVLTCFSSNVARIKSCIAAARVAERKVLLLGTSIKKSIEAAQELGYIDDKDLATFVNEESIDTLDANQLLIICTGSQGEENSALWKMANRMRTIPCSLDKGDTVVFSARVIDNRQTAVRNVINSFVGHGVRVLHPWNSQDSVIHASGHPAQEDIKELLGLIKPRCVIPVHGELEHKAAHINFVTKLDIEGKKDRIEGVNVSNGEMIAITQTSIVRLDKHLKCNRLIYDGARLISDKSQIFTQRKDISENGIIVLSIAYRGTRSHTMMSTFGLFDRVMINPSQEEESQSKPQRDLSKELKSEITKWIKKYTQQDFTQQGSAAKRELVNFTKKWVNTNIGKNPYIACHVL